MIDRDALRNDFVTVRKMIQAERRMRRQVFRNDPAKRAAKVDECDQALAGLTRLGEALRIQLEEAPAAGQPSLFPDGAPGTRRPEY